VSFFIGQVSFCGIVKGDDKKFAYITNDWELRVISTHVFTLKEGTKDLTKAIASGFSATQQVLHLGFDN
jgi:hypothetical protein